MSHEFILILIVAFYLGCVLWVNLPKQPRGLAKLFFAEMWERFSFYGMRALLVLYMTKHLEWRQEDAAGVYAAYGALVYSTPLLGGIVADRILGNRRAVMLGGTLMAIGHFVLAIEHPIAFYGALALLIVGNGFFKPNISGMVGKLYEQGDPRRDSGFTLFYMGVNTGAFLAPLTCGYLGENWGWHYGFGLAGIGMVLGLLVFSIGAQAQLGDVGLPADQEKAERLTIPVWLGAFCILPIFAGLVWKNQMLEGLVPLVAVAGLGYMFYIASQCEKVERDRLHALIGFFFFSVMFWMFFEQAGSSLTLFTDKNVDRHGVPASEFQSVNALMIIALGPVFTWLWTFLAKKHLNPPTPLKFSLALIQVGLGFAMAVVGAKFASDAGLVGVSWLLLLYLFHTMGELCISPVGLSLVTKLAPARIVSFTLGFWYLATSVAHFLGGLVAKSAAISASASAQEALVNYTRVFTQVTAVSVGAGLLLIFAMPKLRKLMHGVH